MVDGAILIMMTMANLKIGTNVLNRSMPRGGNTNASEVSAAENLAETVITALLDSALLGYTVIKF